MPQDWGDEIDRVLLERVARLSRGSQRWLKTAVQVIRTMPSPSERDEYEERYVPPAPRRRLAPAVEPERAAPTSDLEDVIEGRAKLDDQLAAYPELAEELEGLGDIIDMLRQAGKERRKKGEDILREEILGQPPTEDDEGM
jgi:hypothetical protein